jgi:hypothetical protein
MGRRCRSIALKIQLLGAACFFPSAAFGARLFPNREPPLGGSEWERRASAELRLGLQTLSTRQTFHIPDGLEKARPSLGLTLRFHWGPNLGFDADYERVLRTLTTPAPGSRAFVYADRFSVILPLRIAWSEGEYFAPFIGYSYEDLSSTETAADAAGKQWPASIKSIPIGVQVRWDLLGAGFWMQGCLSLLDTLNVERATSTISDPFTASWLTQVDYNFGNQNQVSGVIGLRYEARYRGWKEGGTRRNYEENSLSLVTGTRF